MTALFCTQRDRSAGFGGGTAFFGLAGDGEEPDDWTCDRRELFDARGRRRHARPLRPARAAAASIPARRWRRRSRCAPATSIERVFLLGHGAERDAARALARERRAACRRCSATAAVRARWDALLGATAVQTPDPLFDAMVNRWLLYQTVACRLWAQGRLLPGRRRLRLPRPVAGRDGARLGRARACCASRSLLAASRQFAEGDVQHWWHAPTGAGVRTHFSDDLLWLPHACAHYVATTRRRQRARRARAVPRRRRDPGRRRRRVLRAGVSAHERASVYEHCARAIDRSLASARTACR